MPTPKAPQRDDVTAMVRAAVRRHMDLFYHFHDIDEDDMCQEMFLELGKAWANYDPARRLDTFVFTVVQRKMINKARDRGRRAKHDAVYAAARPGDVVEVEDPILDEPEGAFFEGEAVASRLEPAPTMLEMLNTFVVHARRLTQDASRERRTYHPAQQLAVGAFAKHYKLSVRGTRLQFEERPDLCRVIGFEAPPSRMWFYRAMECLPN